MNKLPMEERVHLREREGEKYGGSAAGIKSHYDISNHFWPKILGENMTYSSGLYRSHIDDLDTAQRQKIHWHFTYSGAYSASTVLDIGCGWGSLLKSLSEHANATRILGLTLSSEQVEYVANLRLPRVEVLLKNWAAFAPDIEFDSILSVGAFEHFANASQSSAEKVTVYRDFFERCHKWLAPAGYMTLQTIAYGDMRREEASAFFNIDIFPDSDLPYLREIVEAVDGLFEIVVLRNDRLDYSRTMDAWARNLARNRPQVTSLVGERKVKDMYRFFKMASVGFRAGKLQLLRFALRPIRKSWPIMGSDRWIPLE